ncbi:MAG: M24 family metallopeptidase, partial [Reyranellales bacterium]
MKPSAGTLVNLRRLGEAMDAAGLDAIVARAGLNFTYLAGFAYPGTLARHVDLADSPRAVYVVWPRRGEPRIVLNAIARDLAARDSWIEAYDVYEGYVEAPIHRVATTLRDMGLAESKVGFEMNYITAADWAQLASLLPNMRKADCAPLMDHVRTVKTEGEIAKLRIGADILDDAFLACFPTVRPGTRERDLHGALVAHCLAGGAEFVHGILNSQRNTIAYGGESDFAFAAGDAIRTDYVCYVKAYPGHQSRCAIVGRATDKQKSEYAVARDVYLSSCAQLKPGRTAGEVYDFVVKKFASVGMDYHHMIAGHSVGAWWHQQEPVISRGNPKVLEAGMVIAMEPHIGHWHIQ